MSEGTQLVINVIAQDKGYSTTLHAVRRAVQQTSGEVQQFGRTSRSSYIEASAAIRLLQGDTTNMVRACEAMVSRSKVLSAVFKTAFPVVGILAVTSVAVQGVERVIKKIEELRNASAETTKALEDMRSSIADGARSMSEKLLAAQERVDDLTGNHLAALQAQLERINDQSLDTIIGQIKELGSVADKAFKSLATPWYLPGIGSAGASNAWSTFSTQYHLLNSTGNTKQAADLLQGTLSRALQGQSLQRQILALPEEVMTRQGLAPNYERGKLQDELKRNFSGLTVKGNDVNSQNTLVSILQGLQKNVSTANTIKGYQDKAAILGANKSIGGKDATVIAEAGLRNLHRGMLPNEYPKQYPSFAAEYGDKLARWRDSDKNPFYRGTRDIDFLRSNLGNFQKEQAQGFMAVSHKNITPDLTKIQIAQVQTDELNGRITENSAAMKIAKLQAKDYASKLQNLNFQLANNNLSPEERQTLIQRRDDVTTQQRIAQISAPGAAFSGSSGVVGVRNALDEFVQASRNAAEAMQRITTGILNQINDQILNAMTGQRTSFGKVGVGVARSIAGYGLQRAEGAALSAIGFGGGKPDGSDARPYSVRIVGGSTSSAASAVGHALSSVGKSTGGVLGFLGRFLSKGFQGYFANGGPMQADMASIVGERGPELFVPRAAGTMIPNHALSGAFGGHQVSVGYIDARQTNPAMVASAVHRGMQLAYTQAVHTVNHQRTDQARRRP